MLDWRTIRTVLLDMDGTLLDLHYDNHFWLEYVPQRFAAAKGLEPSAARKELCARYQRVEGTMDWYCVDYWTRELGLDIAVLKAELTHLIAVRAHVAEFLDALRAAGKRVALVTNAHGKSLGLKLGHTGLAGHFDTIICAHDHGRPKEDPSFWDFARSREHFDNASTLLVDDSLPVLASARAHGIAHLLCVRQPDSRGARREISDYAAIDSFEEIMPVG